MCEDFSEFCCPSEGKYTFVLQAQLSSVNNRAGTESFYQIPTPAVLGMMATTVPKAAQAKKYSLPSAQRLTTLSMKETMLSVQRDMSNCVAIRPQLRLIGLWTLLISSNIQTRRM